MTGTPDLRGARRAAGLLVALAALGSTAILAMPARAAAPSCQPGSGPHLAGKHLDATALSAIDSLQCADLSGADLSGLDLTQADLTGAVATSANFADAKLGQAELGGANFSDADLHGADLTQATLTGTNLAGANLSHSTLDQVDAGGATLTGADLTDASLIQAHLSHANLDDAKVSGADFTQADLDGTSFDGTQGLTSWSTYVLIAALAVFVLIGGLAVRRALGRREKSPLPTPITAPEPTGSYWAQKQGFGAAVATAAPAVGAFNPINGPATRSVNRGIALGLLAAAVIALGAHLFIGGLIGTFSFAFDTLATATCTGATCAVGVGSGTLGLIGGVFVVIGGFAILSRA